MTTYYKYMRGAEERYTLDIQEALRFDQSPVECFEHPKYMFGGRIESVILGFLLGCVIMTIGLFTFGGDLIEHALGVADYIVLFGIAGLFIAFLCMSSQNGSTYDDLGQK